MSVVNLLSLFSETVTAVEVLLSLFSETVKAVEALLSLFSETGTAVEVLLPSRQNSSALNKMLALTGTVQYSIIHKILTKIVSIEYTWA